MKAKIDKLELDSELGPSFLFWGTPEIVDKKHTIQNLILNKDLHFWRTAWGQKLRSLGYMLHEF